ncbi:uncharacterized protein LOC125866923 [Solanum stenotomum]|uniref:uncharacterized protein LOC125866923 n=1 Tax=Solanum stenotomum TaxID=172797 RepID=UPI0020D0DDF3|nr:uncharacterized protein LOC125866923 [Solanum stenotomum]
MASVDPTIAPTVATASSAWDSLHLTYANKSQTRIFSFRDQLARLSKDSRPVADYLHQVRSLYNELATAGATITNDELVVKILSGLGSDAITAAMVTHNKSINSNNCAARRPNNISQWCSNNRRTAPAQGRYINNPVRYQLCNKQGHSANVCQSQSHNHLEAKANFLLGNQVAENQWIVDSGY